MAGENTSRPPSLKEHGEGYQMWKMRFKFFLLSHGKAEALVTEEHADSAKVLGWIGTAVPAAFMLDIEACTSAKAAWERLEELFTEQSQADIYTLESNYNDLALGAKETIADYLNRATILKNQLTTAGIKVDDNQFVRRLLKGLPKVYETYRIMALHGAGPSGLPKLNELKGALMALEAEHSRSRRQEEIALTAFKKLQHKDKPKPGSNASDSSKPDTNNSSSRGDKVKLFCNYCRKTGHTKDNCFKLQNKKAADKAGSAGSTASKQPIVLCSTISSGPFTLSGPNVWVADTGASTHLTSYKGLLRGYTPCDAGSIVYGNASTLSYSGTGDVLLLGSNQQKLLLTGVRHVPDNRFNIVSLPTLMLKGVTLQSGTLNGRPTLELSYNDEVIATAVVYPDVSILLLKVTAVSASQSAICASSADTAAVSPATNGTSIGPSSGTDITPVSGTASELALRPFFLWHGRLGHPSLDYLAKTCQLTSGIDVPPLALKLAKNLQCDICIRSKQCRPAFPSSASQTSAPLELVHMDLCGPLTPKSRDGYGYFLTLLDDFSSYSVVRPLFAKSEAASSIQGIFSFLANHTGLSVKSIRTDRGGEFLNNELDAYLTKSGIVHQKTTAYTPQQNGKAERLNRTLLTTTRALLTDSPLGKSFWGEALQTANYLRNVTPVSGKTAVPYTSMFGVKPDLSHLRQFGCPAYVLTPKHQRDGKLSPVSASGLFVGYPANTKGYKVYIPGTDTIVISRDVRFVESTSSAGFLSPSHLFTLPPTAEEEEESSVQQQEQQSGGGPHQDRPDIGPDNSPDNPDLTPPQSGDEGEGYMPGTDREQSYMPGTGTRTSSRPNRGVPSSKFGDFALCNYNDDFFPEFCLASSSSKDPTYKEAMASPEKEYWQAAITDELASLEAYNTWTLTPVPAGIRLIPTKYVLKKKYNAQGKFERFKARLVVQGFRQVEGIDYNETFSPTSRYSTVRTLFSKAAAEDLELDHLDIKTAFLNGELNEDIYISYPPGFTGPPGHCLKLNKSLYGLKQAPRQWHLRLESELKGIGFTPSLADPALFINTAGSGKAYLLVYVDDIIIATKSKAFSTDIKSKLLTAFDGRDLGPVTSFLGISITRDRVNRSLSMDQGHYTKELLATYKMDGCKPKSVPMDPGLRLSVNDGKPLSLTNCSYGSLIGSLMYLAVSTRPDIAYSVGALARFMSRPTTVSMAAAKALLRYLAGTSGHRLNFSGSSNKLAIYTDSDYAACPDTRKSVSGFVITLNGGAVNWRSKKQSTVTLSTTEAEYVAAAAATREVLWFRHLADSLDIKVDVYNIFGDNKSTLSLIKNPILSFQSKHIDITCHFLRERAARGEVTFTYMPTDQMLADVFTKALPKNKHDECCKGLGVA